MLYTFWHLRYIYWGTTWGGGGGGIFLGAVVYIKYYRPWRPQRAARESAAVERETLQRASERLLQAFKDTLHPLSHCSLYSLFIILLRPTLSLSLSLCARSTALLSLQVPCTVVTTPECSHQLSAVTQ